MSDKALPEDLARALEAVRSATAEEERWDELEELAAKHQRPEEVDALYHEAVLQEHPAEVIVRLGERAVRFHDEWFEDASPLVSLLARVVQRDPSQRWAFDRATLIYNYASRWDDLLGFYDGVLAADRDPDRRMQLLDEAAHTAKDLAAQPDRAIGYLEQLLVLKAHDNNLVTLLERLYERQGRHGDLVRLWGSRLSNLAPAAALALRGRIASTQLHSLNDAAGALGTVREVFSQEPNDAGALKILAEVVGAEATPSEVRLEALELLLAHFDRTQKPKDAIEALGRAIDRSPEAARSGLHRQRALRRRALEDMPGAQEDLAAVLVLRPSDEEARGELRELAEKTGRHAAFAEALASAGANAAEEARRAALWLEGAQVLDERAGDSAAAVERYEAVLGLSGAERSVLRMAARAAVRLLDALGRREALLDTLERQASLEEESAERREALARAARLARELEQFERALNCWRQVLVTSAEDVEALDAVVELVDAAGRSRELVDALRQRSALATEPAKVRADLVRVARTLFEPLGDVAAAVDAWREVESRCGRDDETIDTLSSLLEHAGRQEELEALLREAIHAASSGERRAELLVRLGENLRRRGAAQHALECFRSALHASPTQERAREGLQALRADATVGPQALEALADSFRNTERWAELLELTEARYEARGEAAEKVTVLCEAAKTSESHLGRAEDALSYLRRALPLTVSEEIESELLRLAEQTKLWATAAEGYVDALRTEGVPQKRHDQLSFQLGTIRERHQDDLPGALEAYRAVADAEPESMAAGEAVVRVASRIGQWSTAAAATVRMALHHGEQALSLLSLLEDAARAEDQWEAAAGALQHSLVEDTALGATVARELHARVAQWHRDRLSDQDAAEQAFLRAAARDQGHVATLEALAQTQRRHPDAGLLRTLGLLATATEDALAVVHEAASVADSQEGLEADAPAWLDRLLAAARSRWEESAVLASGEERSAAWCAQWAVDHKVALWRRRGDVARAVQELLSATELPLPDADRRALRRRAAQLRAEELQDAAGAMELYRALLAEAPGDVEVLEALAKLLEAAGRWDELVTLRQHELSLGPSHSRQLELNLELAAIWQKLGNDEKRLEALKANLELEAGHRTSVAQLREVLGAQAKHAALCDLLSEQARRVEESSRTDDAAELWTMVAQLAEVQLGDVSRALAALRKVVQLRQDRDTLDALARLHLARKEFPSAVGWLEQRLALSDDAERGEVTARLAKAMVNAAMGERAVGLLEQSLEAQPGATSLRALLAEQYRTAGRWEALGRTLAEGAEHCEDAALHLAWLRELAEVRLRRLEDAQGAVPVLRKAAELAPQDRSVRAQLAEALRGAGSFDESVGILQGLLEEYGRRRPPERAVVHFQLAQIASARGDRADAIAQLEQATAMDMSHAGALQMLGQLYMDGQQWDKAERVWRALLVVVRRHSQPLDSVASGSEILFTLHKIALQLNASERAQELLESAFEVAQNHPADAQRFEALLRQQGLNDLLLRSLQARTERTEDPSERALLAAQTGEVFASLGRHAEALEMVLKALRLAPGDAQLFERASGLAQTTGQQGHLADELQKLAAAAREQGDAGVASALWLHVASLREGLGASADALGALREAEACEERLPDVWRAIDRIAGGLGDVQEQARALRELVQRGGEQVPAEEQTELLYRVAALDFASPAHRGEGVEMLSWALDRAPDLARAAAMVRPAALAEDTPAEVAGPLVQLFERVARQSEDQGLLLDALERALSLPERTDDQLREAVSLGRELEQNARAEALIGRGVERGEGLEAATLVWALQQKAELRRIEGDVRGAVDALRAAAKAAPPEEQFALGEQAARSLEVELDDAAGAAELYEMLRQTDATDRRVWEPLLRLYRVLNDRERLASLIAATVESVSDSDERNQLRLERAKLLLEEADGQEGAIAVLRDVLSEDAGHQAAAELLAATLEKQGQTEELAELLQQQLDIARDRAEAERIGALSEKLGGLWEANRSEDAREVYRAAHEWVPERRALIEGVLRLTPEGEDWLAEKVDWMEKLLAVESGAAASALAQEIVTQRQKLGDNEGAERVLDLAFRRSPEDEALRQRLVKMYTERQDWERLASLLSFEGEARKDSVSLAVSRLREAANMYRDKLGDLGSASGVLRKARALRPADVALLNELLAVLEQAGDPQAALEAVSEALTPPTKGSQRQMLSAAVRVSLLRQRAKLYGQLERYDEAVSDLEQLAQQEHSLRADLAEALERARSAARGVDGDKERGHTLRLVEVLQSQESLDAARDVLVAWASEHTEDKDALQRLVELETARQDWPSVAQWCGQLFGLEAGEARVAVALRLADAADKYGAPDDARGVLEQALTENAERADLRDRLKQLYERAGALRELAGMVLAEADAAADDAGRFAKLREAGELLVRAGDAANAITVLEQALALKPGEHEATVYLVDAYIAGYQIAEATELLQTAIATHKGRRTREVAMLQHRMARAALAAGQQDVCFQWLRVAMETDMQNGVVASELADLAMNNGNHEVALKALRVLTMLKTPAPITRAMAFLRQGVIAQQQGDPKRAVTLARKALQEDPQLGEATEFLRSLGAE